MSITVELNFPGNVLISEEKKIGGERACVPRAAQRYFPLFHSCKALIVGLVTRKLTQVRFNYLKKLI